MQYLSTRDSALRVSAQEAIVRGLAPQSGLFVPETFPQADLDAWKNLSYPELAEKVLAGFLTDYSADFLHTATASTYGAAFGGKAGETVKVRDGLYSLELWHGPTCAFKDYALQLMPKLLVEAKKMLGRTETTRILVATSGDTGKAALEGFCDVPGTRIVVFYPEDGVSDVQKLLREDERWKALESARREQVVYAYLKELEAAEKECQELEKKLQRTARNGDRVRGVENEIVVQRGKLR